MEWWCPPGGGVEGDESILACAEREALEETGLRAVADRVVYLLDFISEPPRHILELYVLMRDVSGEPRVPDNDVYLKEARFLSREDARRLLIYPPVFRSEFWDDLAGGFSKTRYLGVRHYGEP